MLKLYHDKECLEAGVDEVARGCLAGRVYSAAVIWPKTFEKEDAQLTIRDSKKCSRRRRLILKDYIEEYAIDTGVGWVDEKAIDEINIRRATARAMHRALNRLNVPIESIIVDGKRFKPYFQDGHVVPWKCFIHGDATYVPIACASILAKVYHDQYIEALCDAQPELDHRYGWRSNMTYGTEKHMNGIKIYGLTPYHRRTFGICKNYA